MIRHEVLDDVGDLCAPPGSREWAVAVCLNIQNTLNDIHGDASHLRAMIALIREHKGYRRLADARKRPFATYAAFCIAKQPFGLGYDPDDIDAIIHERTARAAQERAAEPMGLGDHPGRCIPDVIRNTPKEYGTSAEYLTARIARDRPEILERMKAGEFASVRAAAREAGIVRPTATIYTDRPEDAARAILRHFRGDRLEALIRALRGD